MAQRCRLGQIVPQAAPCAIYSASFGRQLRLKVHQLWVERRELRINAAVLIAVATAFDPKAVCGLLSRRKHLENIVQGQLDSFWTHNDNSAGRHFNKKLGALVLSADHWQHRITEQTVVAVRDVTQQHSVSELGTVLAKQQPARQVSDECLVRSVLSDLITQLNVKLYFLRWWFKQFCSALHNNSLFNCTGPTTKSHGFCLFALA